MLKKKSIFVVLLFLLITGSSKLFAQVNPEILLGARGVMSLNLNKISDEESSAVSDFFFIRYSFRSRINQTF
jgi:hypothetical protein